MAVELVNRLAILVALRRFPSLGVGGYRSFRCESYIRMREFVRWSTNVPFRRFLRDVRREFTQRLSVALNSTLGSYRRDALQKGGAAVVACLLAMRA
jgi:hypothetical protein